MKKNIFDMPKYISVIAAMYSFKKGFSIVKRTVLKGDSIYLGEGGKKYACICIFEL
jgi:hypothetical protein